MKLYKNFINGVFTGVFTYCRVACEDAGRAAYSHVRLYVTDEYNHQEAGISSPTTEYVACHPVYTQRVHSYSRSQKLEISSVYSVPTRTDFSIQVPIFFKIRFYTDFFISTDFWTFVRIFFLKRPFL